MKTVAPLSSNSGGGSGSRWCPTPEQVMLLEGMYRGGLKTPTAAQIQQITARLSLYGRIQGKNVFYWFQNHKARDRQKMQRKLLAMHQHQRLHPPNNSPYDNNPYPFALQDDAGVVEQKSSGRNMFREENVDQTFSKVMCDCSLMTITRMESTSPNSTRVQPKTLQLFPTSPSQPK